MSYYSQAFFDLCADPHGEAMQSRLYVRLNDGSNLFSNSNDLSDSSWTIHADLLAPAYSTPAGLPQFGYIHEVVRIAAVDGWAPIYFDDATFDYGWCVWYHNNY